MGRRSINTTKSGKFMNPTDQARKEARKKELKKNKKQRQMVRAAVLKGKDPNHLIGEMEKIDRMEYDVNNPPLLNEKVLKDKRKKLRETFARVMKLYEKEDPDQYKELRKLEGEYEIKRNFLMQYYESVKHAQQVQVEDIPLPSMQMPSMLTSQIPLPSDIPLPTAAQLPTHSILKKTSIYEQMKDYMEANMWNKVKMPPGVPPGLPLPLSDVEDNDGDEADVEMSEITRDDAQSSGGGLEKPRKIRFADDDATADNDKDTRLTLSKSGKRSDTSENVSAVLSRSAPKGGESRLGGAGPLPPALPPGLPPGPPPGLPPGPPPGLPPMMFRPPPMRPPVRLPPGPPPGRPPGPPGHHPGMPPRMLGPPPNRLPPGPPPGMPPHRMLMRPPGLPPANMAHQLGHLSLMPQTGATSVLSAPPSLISRPKSDDDHKKSATIEAKPQIRNLSADVTRFMPTSLRVKREERTKKREQKPLPLGITDDISISMMKSALIAAPTKDDAYDQFMREMEDLL